MCIWPIFPTGKDLYILYYAKCNTLLSLSLSYTFQAAFYSVSSSGGICHSCIAHAHVVTARATGCVTCSWIISSVTRILTQLASIHTVWVFTYWHPTLKIVTNLLTEGDVITRNVQVEKNSTVMQLVWYQSHRKEAIYESRQQHLHLLVDLYHFCCAQRVIKVHWLTSDHCWIMFDAFLENASNVAIAA